MKASLLLFYGHIGLILGLQTLPTKDHKRSYDYEDGDLSEEDYKTRIVGGQPVGQRAIRHQLHFSYKGEVECGASLIEVYGVQLAITASHCLWLGYPSLDSFMEARFLYITAGDLKLNDTDSFHQDQDVVKVVPHPDYDPKYNTHDISLLFLKAPFQESARVEPIDLPGHDWELPRDLLISGWGSAVLWDELQNELMFAIVYPVPQDECEAFSKIPTLNIEITDNQFCAGSMNGEQVGTCSGDSGGPAMGYNKTEDKYYLAGITSFGISYVCGNPYYPTVFVRVPRYVDWIRIEVSKHIEEMG